MQPEWGGCGRDLRLPESIDSPQSAPPADGCSSLISPRIGSHSTFTPDRRAIARRIFCADKSPGTLPTPPTPATASVQMYCSGSRPTRCARLTWEARPVWWIIMTLRWATYFSLAALSLSAATVTGHVELRDSRDPAVRSRADFSGVVVSFRSVQGGAAPQSNGKHASMLQKGKTFKPHVLAIPMGSMVDFPNADPIFHNAFSSYSGQIFDVGLYPPGSTRSVRFGREGIVRVFCNIHSSMSAVIAVVATPYFAVTNRDGAFEIADVPPGEYDMTVFHE